MQSNFHQATNRDLRWWLRGPIRRIIGCPSWALPLNMSRPLQTLLLLKRSRQRASWSGQTLVVGCNPISQSWIVEWRLVQEQSNPRMKISSMQWVDLMSMQTLKAWIRLKHEKHEYQDLTLVRQPSSVGWAHLQMSKSSPVIHVPVLISSNITRPILLTLAEVEICMWRINLADIRWPSTTDRLTS